MQKQETYNLFREYRSIWIGLASFLMVLLLWQFIIWGWGWHLHFWVWLNAAGSPEYEIKVAEVSRNRGWLAWAVGTFVIAIIGITLTIWGRVISIKQNKQTQDAIEKTGEQIELTRQANINERFEKAANMLGSENVTVRIAGCIAFPGLAEDNKEMASEYINLLNVFRKKQTNEYQEAGKNIEEDVEEAIKSIVKILAVSEDATLGLLDLSGIDLKEINLRGMNLSGVKLQNANFANINLGGINLQNADLTGANLQKANLQNANLENADLSKARLREANLQDANLISTGLDRARLQNANLIEAKLQNTDLRKANLQDADLENANLENANLENANLENVDLRKANLKDANLSMAYLQNADLKEANLENTNLAGADLESTNLAGANLKNANLDKANLQNAHLGFADTADANFEDAKGLTKSQVISAQWNTRNGESHHPVLPENLMRHEEIKQWCKMPDFDYRDGEKIRLKDKMIWRKFNKPGKG